MASMVKFMIFFLVGFVVTLPIAYYRRDGEYWWLYAAAPAFGSAVGLSI